MEIILTYKITDTALPQRFQIVEAEYYDAISPNENYWDDGIVKCIFPHEYVETPVTNLDWLTITVSNNKMSRVTRCQYVDADSVMMQHITDEFCNEEIIISTLLPDMTWQISRVQKPNAKSWFLYSNILASDEKVNGAYPSIEYCQNKSMDQLKAFSEIPSTNL